MKTKRASVGCLVLLVSLLLLLWWAWPALNDMFQLEPWSFRKARFQRAAERAQPLADAIKRYISELGRPPETLPDLVPNYLKRVPRTGLREYPTFEYSIFTNSLATN